MPDAIFCSHCATRLDPGHGTQGRQSRGIALRISVKQAIFRKSDFRRHQASMISSSRQVEAALLRIEYDKLGGRGEFGKKKLG